MCHDIFHHLFFWIANLKKFSWWNVIQQIKNVSPNVHQNITQTIHTIITCQEDPRDKYDKNNKTDENADNKSVHCEDEVL